MCECVRPVTYSACEDYCDACGGYVPVVLGGQGRDATEVISGAWAVALGVVVLLFIGAAVWVASIA